MCNRIRNDIKKANLELAKYGFHEFSETRIRLDFPEARFDSFPDSKTLVIRLSDGDWRLDEMRWGFAPPPKGDRPVTNVRNLDSPFWRAWLKPEWRCLVPATSFAEWSDERPRRERWFARHDGGFFMFAGIWRPWSGTRGTKSAHETGEHKLFAILTCEPNDVVRPVHAKAMPVMLTTHRQWRDWLEAPVEIAMGMARPAADEDLALVA